MPSIEYLFTPQDCIYVSVLNIFPKKITRKFWKTYSWNNNTNAKKETQVICFSPQVV